MSFKILKIDIWETRFQWKLGSGSYSDSEGRLWNDAAWGVHGGRGRAGHVNRVLHNEPDLYRWVHIPNLYILRVTGDGGIEYFYRMTYCVLFLYVNGYVRFPLFEHGEISNILMRYLEIDSWGL